MIVRAIDSSNDWTFGAGLNNYLSGNLAVAQNIKTRLQSFVGNCFFDMGAGINWFNFLGGKGSNNTLQLSLALSSVILNTPDTTSNPNTIAVTGILQLNFNLTPARNFSITYQVQTLYSVTGDSFQYNLGGGSFA